MVAAVINPAQGSRRQTILVKETIVDQTPVGANWQIFRNTGGAGLAQTIETTESQELSGAVLGVRDVIETQRSSELNYNSEFPMDGIGSPYYTLLESLLGDEWGTTVANGLRNDNTDIRFTIEDQFTDIATYQTASGCLCTELALTIENNAIITATWTGLGTTFTRPLKTTVQAGIVPGTDDVVFVSATSTMTVNAGVPAGVGANDFVGITNANTSANDGYYRILSVAGNDVVLEGLLTDDASDTTATLVFSGQPVSVTSGGTVDPIGIETSAKAGDFIQVDLDGQDSLNFGLRFTSSTITISRVAQQLYEITLDDPFTTLSTDFTATIAFEWHLINDYLLDLLDIQTDHTLTIVVEDNDSNSLTFEFDRIRFSEGSFGEATRGESMTGTCTATALLPVNNEMVRVISS